MDDNVFDSELYDDEDDIIAAHGQDFSMGGMLADEEEGTISTMTLQIFVLTNGRLISNQWIERSAHNIHPKITFNEANEL